MPTLTKARALHPSVYDAHVATQRAYRVVHGATAIYPTASFVQVESGGGTAVNMVKLNQLATAQEKMLRDDGVQGVLDYPRSGWANTPHQSHAERRLEHKKLKNLRQPQKHFVASPMDKLKSPQTSIGNTRPVIYMSASVGTAVEATSPKRIRQRNVQSKMAGRPPWLVEGKDVSKTSPRHQQSKKDLNFKISSHDEAGPAIDALQATGGRIEAISPKRVKDRRRLAGDRPFTSTLPMQPNRPLYTMERVTIDDFEKNYSLKSQNDPKAKPAVFASHNGSCSTSISRRREIPTMRLSRDNRRRKPQATPLVRMLKGDHRLSYVKEIVANARAHRGMD